MILKPVALIVLSLAGNAAAAGLSFGSGVPGSVGTILAATVIFALAAFAPWALMYLLAADAESAYVAAGLRAAAGSRGRAMRTAARCAAPAACATVGARRSRWQPAAALRRAAVGLPWRWRRRSGRRRRPA